MPPPTNLRTSLRALPPAAWILFFGTFLNKFGSFVVPFLALYLTRKGYSLTQAGEAIGMYGIGNVLATLVGGHLADHLGRRKTIALSMITGACSMMLLSQAQALPVILCCAFLAGITGELYRPASSALLTDLVPADQRVPAFSVFRMSFNAGWAFGPATAGILASHGFFWLFAGDAATSALFGIVALAFLPDTAATSVTSCSWMEATRTLARDRRLHQVLFASICMAFIFFQMNSTYGLAVVRLGYSPATYGALISLNGALVVLFELPLTTVTRRFPALRVVALGFFVAGLGFALNAFASSIPALAACIVLFTLGEMCAMPVASAYVAELSPSNMRGRYMGTYGLTWTLAQVLGPGLGMRFYSANPTAYWLAGGALGAIATAILLAPKPSPTAVPVKLAA